VSRELNIIKIVKRHEPNSLKDDNKQTVSRVNNNNGDTLNDDTLDDSDNIETYGV
jgi:hypothetical protein